MNDRAAQLDARLLLLDVLGGLEAHTGAWGSWTELPLDLQLGLDRLQVLMGGRMPALHAPARGPRVVPWFHPVHGERMALLASLRRLLVELEQGEDVWRPLVRERPRARRASNRRSAYRANVAAG